MRYEDTIRFLDDLYRRPFIPSSRARLDRAAFLLDQVGNPHRAFRVVHVAGSTGKGSTSAMVAGMLRASGVRTGEFRSPHLIEYTERIAVDGTDITQAEWSALAERLIPVALSMESDAISGYALGRPTLFELLFALAALHFKDAGVEWAVLETGLGGRLDATNLAQSEVAVITNISLEHTQILGSTIPAIAREKAAIIKPHASVVTATEGEALEVVQQQAQEVAAPLLVVGRDVEVRRTPNSGGQRLTLTGGATTVHAQFPSAAAYQSLNAATAFGVALSLRKRGIGISDRAIQAGIENFALSGRYEELPGTPNVLLDGAHNLAGMRALADSLNVVQDVLLFAAMDDKDIEGMARAISEHIRCVVVTQVPGTSRSADLDRVREAFLATGRDAVAISEPEEAFRQAMARAGHGTLLVAGSLYLVGLVRKVLMAVPA